MNLDEYENEAARTDGMKDAPREAVLSWVALGLTGEAGEFADEIKKVLYHRRPLDQEKLLVELGDVLWYLTRAAHYLDADLRTLAELNVRKLRRRYPDGFSPEASAMRQDTL